MTWRSVGPGLGTYTAKYFVTSCVAQSPSLYVTGATRLGCICRPLTLCLMYRLGTFSESGGMGVVATRVGAVLFCRRTSRTLASKRKEYRCCTERTLQRGNGRHRFLVEVLIGHVFGPLHRDFPWWPNAPEQPRMHGVRITYLRVHPRRGKGVGRLVEDKSSSALND